MLATYVSVLDRLFRVGETRVGVTKYAFLSIKVPRALPSGRTVGALIQPRENPYAASSVWGITNYVELAGHVFDLITQIKCSLTVIG